jgi:hypothetical protein
MEPRRDHPRTNNPGVFVSTNSKGPAAGVLAPMPEEQGQSWIHGIALLFWLVAAALVFIPFARNTSAWDAVRMHVPGEQGNWWHVLVGAPFFLAYPMVWLRVRLLFGNQAPTQNGRRAIWSIAGLSAVGTIAVETPFLLHLAGTGEWQRLWVLSAGFGIIIASAAILFLRRNQLSPTQACIANLETAYIANAVLCLIVYSDATGTIASRLGWVIAMIIVWPIAAELIWLLVRACLRAPLPKAHVAF